MLRGGWVLATSRRWVSRLQYFQALTACRSVSYELLNKLKASVPNLHRSIGMKKTDNSAYRSAAGVALLTAFILVWVNGAVGIIGSENNPANLMYFGVLAVGVIGAVIARFQPRGMTRALFATALAQALVAAIAVIDGLGLPWSPPLEIVLLNGFFVALWVGSAWLFRSASRKHPPGRRAAWLTRPPDRIGDRGHGPAPRNGD